MSSLPVPPDPGVAMLVTLVAAITIFSITWAIIKAYRVYSTRGYYLSDFSSLSNEARELSLQTRRFRLGIEASTSTFDFDKTGVLKDAENMDKGIRIALSAWEDIMQPDDGEWGIGDGNMKGDKLVRKRMKKHQRYVIGLMRKKCFEGVRKRRELAEILKAIERECRENDTPTQILGNQRQIETRHALVLETEALKFPSYPNDSLSIESRVPEARDAFIPPPSVREAGARGRVILNYGDSQSMNGARNDTFSVDSSITKYRMENGRSYHAYKEGTYWAPNDEKQNENLDISHHKFLLLLGGKLFLAPLEKTIQNALDIGTGTGIWAIDFADEFPDTNIYGTDLSAIQPSMVPPNCRFEIDDARDPWVYPTDFFDYIHIRSLFGSIEDWPALYGQAFKHLKPGGYIEQLELSIDMTSDDATLTPDNPLTKLVNLFKEAGEITGKTFQVFDTMRQQIEAAGFVNVVEQIFKLPLGGWPADAKLREIGQLNLLSFDIGLEGYVLATLTRVLGWNRNEVHVFLAQLRKAARDSSIHSYYGVKIVYAQKPPGEEVEEPGVPEAAESNSVS